MDGLTDKSARAGIPGRTINSNGVTLFSRSRIAGMMG
jgi:hypothetical protein